MSNNSFNSEFIYGLALGAVAAAGVMTGGIALGAFLSPSNYSGAQESHPSSVQSYSTPSSASPKVPTLDTFTATPTPYAAHSIPGVFALDIPDCPTETEHDCIWDAGTSGNGEGQSFIDYHGHVYYIDSTYDY